MEYKKITAEDIAGKGVVGQADTPLLSALEMQNKVEEVPRAVIIPHFNSLIDSLDKRDADVDTALSDRYTKTETDKAIGDKLTEIGAGDMAKAIYDTDGDGVVDNAQKLGGQPAEHYATKEELTETQQQVSTAMPKVQYVTQAGTDLNDYKQDGFYYFDVDYTPANIPAGVNGWLEVYSSNVGAVKQKWFRHGTADSNDHNTYIRTFTSDSWSGWAFVMTAKGGTFAGNVKAYETARTTRGLFNNETRAGSTTGTLQSVKYFIDVT